MGLAVVDQAQVGVAVLGEQRLGLGDVDEAAQSVRDLAAAVIRCMGLEPTGEALEQQVGRPGRSRSAVGARLGQPVDLAVDHEAAAGLEDVLVAAPAGARPRRAPPAGGPTSPTTSAGARWQASSARTPSSVNPPSPSRVTAPPAPSSVPSRSTYRQRTRGLWRLQGMMNVRLPSSLP